MTVDFTALLDALGTSVFVSGLVPLLFGGVFAFLKPWLLSEEDFRNRVALLKEMLIEKLSAHLAGLLEGARSSDAILRGETADADPIAAYIKENIRLLAVFRALDSLRRRVRTAYSALLLTSIGALVALLIAIPFEAARAIVALWCYVLIVIQVTLVVYLRSNAKNLEEREYLQ